MIVVDTTVLVYAALVFADPAFGSVPRLRHVGPGTAEFEGLLAA